MAGTNVKALPRNSILVKVGNGYRVVWKDPDLGYVWYSIDSKHLKDVYEDSKPDARYEVDSKAQFESQFGNTYFGNVAEVSLKHDTPWEDLKEKVENQFGFVPGLDTPEIKLLLLQAFFEGWSENQWTVEYRKTKYYNGLTDKQRQWASMSEAEKRQSTLDVATEMANYWESVYGDPRSPATLMQMAQRIASGEVLMGKWQYDTRQAAGSQEGTTEYSRRQQQERDAREEGNLIENMRRFTEDEYRRWVGPGEISINLDWWANTLADGRSSEADLQNRLREVATARWQYKPPDATYQDWSAGYKARIRDELELASIDDNDPLLMKVLGTDQEAQNLTQLIRQDKRFLGTNRMFNELSSGVADLGRRFGFIT